MHVQATDRLAQLRRDRDAARTRLIELELTIATLVASATQDIRGEIAEAEERGDWCQAARLRAACLASGPTR